VERLSVVVASKLFWALGYNQVLVGLERPPGLGVAAPAAASR
jgi:hypothetical protein